MPYTLYKSTECFKSTSANTMDSGNCLKQMLVTWGGSWERHDYMLTGAGAGGYQSQGVEQGRRLGWEQQLKLQGRGQKPGLLHWK